MTEYHVVAQFVAILMLMLSPAILAFQRCTFRFDMWKLVIAVIPYLVLGFLCVNMLSVDGHPTVEWLYPGIVMALVSQLDVPLRLARIVRSIVFLLSFLLIVNATYLHLSSHYVWDAESSLVHHGVKGRIQLAAIRDCLLTIYSKDVDLPEAPVSMYLDLKRCSYVPLEDYQIISVDNEWHTLVTRLYHLKRTKCVIWYPGGKIETGAQLLELRNVDE